LSVFRSLAIALNKSHRLNEEINVPEVRLIGKEGEQLGVVSARQAMYLAEEAGMDLVEIAPLAQPPVCRVMDYGKFKYQEAKKAHEAKLKQKQVQVKEVKFRPGTDENDYQIKLRNMVRFLEEEDKVKVTLRFRGREMAHQEFGMRQLERIKQDLDPYGQVEQMPRMEGRQMIMIVAPIKKKIGEKMEAVAEKPAKATPEKPARVAKPKPAATTETAAAVVEA
jgi:translation initiation factor IF-3